VSIKLARTSCTLDIISLGTALPQIAISRAQECWQYVTVVDEKNCEKLSVRFQPQTRGRTTFNGGVLRDTTIEWHIIMNTNHLSANYGRPLYRAYHLTDMLGTRRHLYTAKSPSKMWNEVLSCQTAAVSDCGSFSVQVNAAFGGSALKMGVELFGFHSRRVVTLLNMATSSVATGEDNRPVVFQTNRNIADLCESQHRLARAAGRQAFRDAMSSITMNDKRGLFDALHEDRAFRKEWGLDQGMTKHQVIHQRVCHPDVTLR